MASTPASSKQPDGKGLADEGARWIKRIDAAAAAEKDWLKAAHSATVSYRGEDNLDGDASADDLFDYNIIHSNVETIVPAIINSPPIPEVRRRFGDDDPAARLLGQIIERAIDVQIDDGKLDVELEALAQDGFLAGRGLIRLRFMSDDDRSETDDAELAELSEADDGADGVANASDYDAPGADPEPGADADDEPQAPVPQTNERIVFEAVPWADARHGPAKRWDQVPWWAFRHAMSCEDVDDFQDRNLVAAQTRDTDEPRADMDSDETIWEIWDARSRSVIFVREHDKKVLKKQPDPLKLSKFFPIADPVQPITVNGRLAPVCPVTIYRVLAEELDVITKRIRKLTKLLKVRALFLGSIPDLAKLSTLDDGEFAAVEDVEQFAAENGLDKAIAWWPIDQIISVLAQLHIQRESTKEAIYEVTGISDIVRGASAPSETATAQNIKSQWGSLRIQKMQRMMQRAARDIMVMMSEIIPDKFSMATLQKITGISLAPAPGDTQEDQQAKLGALALMKQPVATSYRVDVETDSTIRADMSMKRQDATGFLGASGQFFSAVGPLVEPRGPLPMAAVAEIYVSFTRLFDLGKNVEDTLDQMVALAKQKAEEAAKAPQQAPPPNPELIKAQGEAQAKQGDLQIRGQEIQQKDRQAQISADTELKKTAAQVSADRWKATLAALVQIEVARIGAKADTDSAILDAQLEGMLGFAQMEHDKLAQDGGGLGAADPSGAVSAQPATPADGAIPAAPSAPPNRPLRAGAQQHQAITQALDGLAGHQGATAAALAQVADAIKATAAAHSAPKRVVFGPDGRPAGIETVVNQ